MSASTRAFLDMLSAERGAAANTLAAYARDLDGAEDLIGDLAEAAREDVAKLSGAQSLGLAAIFRFCDGRRLSLR